MGLLAEADVLTQLAAIAGAPASDWDPQLAWSLNLEAVLLLNCLPVAQASALALGALIARWTP